MRIKEECENYFLFEPLGITSLPKKYPKHPFQKKEKKSIFTIETTSKLKIF